MGENTRTLYIVPSPFNSRSLISDNYERGAHFAFIIAAEMHTYSRSEVSKETERESTFPRRAPLIIHHYVNGNARHGHHWGSAASPLLVHACMRDHCVSKKRAPLDGEGIRDAVCDVPR